MRRAVERIREKMNDKLVTGRDNRNHCIYKTRYISSNNYNSKDINVLFCGKEFPSSASNVSRILNEKVLTIKSAQISESSPSAIINNDKKDISSTYSSFSGAHNNVNFKVFTCPFDKIDENVLKVNCDVIVPLMGKITKNVIKNGVNNGKGNLKLIQQWGFV